MSDLTALWNPQISLEEFEAKKRPDDKRVVMPCLCGKDYCEGWAAVAPRLYDMMKQASAFADRAAEILDDR